MVVVVFVVVVVVVVLFLQVCLLWGDMSSPKSAPGSGPISRGALRDDSVKTLLKATGIAIGKRQRDVGSVVVAVSR